MQIEFEGSNFITARNVRGDVVIRCNSQHTDIRDDEPLDAFVARHGGATQCAYKLIDFHRRTA